MKVILLLEDGTIMEVNKVVNYNVFVDESSERGQELDEQSKDEITKQDCNKSFDVEWQRAIRWKMGITR